MHMNFMRMEVAVMEPLYQINLGYIARTMKNFGLSKLYLINPGATTWASKPYNIPNTHAKY